MEKLELENTWFERCFNQGETLAVGKPISGIGELWLISVPVLKSAQLIRVGKARVVKPT